MEYNIAVVQGDGIGKEVTNAAMNVLTKVGERFNHSFNFNKSICGGDAIDKYNQVLPKESLDICLRSDSVLFGAMGSPKYDYLPFNKRPESVLLNITKEMNLYAAIRQAKLLPTLSNQSPLKKDKSIDIIVVRELLGDIYNGNKGIRPGKIGREGFDEMRYSELEVEQVARIAFELAENRNKKVLSVDKANVLATSAIWRKIVHDINEDYPSVVLEDLLIDDACSEIIKNPENYDVILAGNLFGDIMSSVASSCVGRMGTQSNAYLGDTNRGLYMQASGSNANIAGQNIVNPIGEILASAMMLKYSFNLNKESLAIENAVIKTLEKGYRTSDIMSENKIEVSTTSMCEEIINNI